MLWKFQQKVGEKGYKLVIKRISCKGLWNLQEYFFTITLLYPGIVHVGTISTLLFGKRHQCYNRIVYVWLIVPSSGKVQWKRDPMQCLKRHPYGLNQVLSVYVFRVACSSSISPVTLYYGQERTSPRATRLSRFHVCIAVRRKSALVHEKDVLLRKHGPRGRSAPRSSRTRDFNILAFFFLLLSYIYSKTSMVCASNIVRYQFTQQCQTFLRFVERMSKL